MYRWRAPSIFLQHGQAIAEPTQPCSLQSGPSNSPTLGRTVDSFKPLPAHGAQSAPSQKANPSRHALTLNESQGHR